MKFKLKRSFIAIIILGIYCQCISDRIIDYNGEPLLVKELDLFINSAMDSLEIPGLSLAIINDSKIVYHRAIGSVKNGAQASITANSIFEAASLSKPVFAYWVMQMSERGIIDLDRPLHFYLPDKKMEIDSRYKQINSKMVLSHSTGFPNWRWFDPIPDSLDIERGEFFMIDSPGTSFTYSGEGYQYLARVIASLNFLNMNELGNKFRVDFALPLDMNLAFFIWDDFLYDNKVFGHINGKPIERNWGSGLPHQNSLIFNAAGGLHTEAVSYANFLIQLMNRRGLNSNSFNNLLKLHTALPPDHNYYTRDGVVGWSLGFGIVPKNSDTLYVHGGSNSDFQSNFAFSIKKRFGYVFFVNCDKGYNLNLLIQNYLSISTNK